MTPFDYPRPDLHAALRHETRRARSDAGPAPSPTAFARLATGLFAAAGIALAVAGVAVTQVPPTTALLPLIVAMWCTVAGVQCRDASRAQHRT